MAWLRSKYGNVRFLDAGAGRKFRLVRVDETTGPATIMVRVLAADGSNQNGQPVANHWPDDSLPDLRGGGLRTLWQPRAITQSTAGGHTGFGLGTGSYIRNPAEGGPHTIWVLSPTLKSDGLAGVVAMTISRSWTGSDAYWLAFTAGLAFAALVLAANVIMQILGADKNEN